MTRRHACGRPLSGVEEATALAELAEVAHGRVDLPAQEAGLAIGFPRPGRRCAALISRWIEEGRPRAAAVRQTPFTG